jgi:hypothetical protein
MIVVVLSEQRQHLVRAVTVIDNGWFGSMIFRGTNLSHLSFVAHLQSRRCLVASVWSELFDIFLCLVGDLCPPTVWKSDVTG